MSTDVRVETVIDRPRTEVAAYMFDPRHDAAWTTGVVACRPLTEGRLRTGSRVERTVSFLGRKFSYTYEVTGDDGDRFVEMLVTQPFPMHVRYELDDAGDQRTHVAIHAKGDATGFFRFAAPFMNGMVRKNIARDLAQLKREVESHSAR
jgi:hypothetical protein